MLARVWLIGATAIALAFAMAGCGSGDDAAERDVTTAVEELQKAFEVGDLEAICRGTTKDVHRQLDMAGHGTPAPCPDSLSRILTMIEEGLLSSGAPRVQEVRVHDNEAVAVLESGSGTQTTVPLERSGGRWRMSNFFGVAALPEAEPRSPAIFRTGPSTVPDPSGEPVTATRAGSPCPALTGEPEPARNGCKVRISGPQSFRVTTALGSFPLGDCELDGVLQVASDGRVALHDVGVHGPSPCNDVRGCGVQRFERTPWNGILRRESDDRLVGRMEVCLDTCVGRFTGPAAFVIESGSSGWRMSFDDSPVGSGSLTLSGDGDLRGMDAFELQSS